MAMARSVGDRRAQMALMAQVVGRGQELLQAALGRRRTCGGPNVSLVMILSVDVAMGVGVDCSSRFVAAFWFDAQGKQPVDGLHWNA